MPIAIVAPFSRSEPPTDKIHENNNNNEDGESPGKDCPQDLSLKGHNPEPQCLDLTKNTNLNKNLNPREQLRNYLLKGEEATTNNSLNNRNVFKEDKQIPDLYSIMNSLDNKFLTAWYVNSLIQNQTQQQPANPYLNIPRRPSSVSSFESGKSNSPSSNRILNNLLEKKPYTTYSFPNGFDALIKNEVQEDDVPEKPHPRWGSTPFNLTNHVIVSKPNEYIERLCCRSQDHKNNVDGKNNQDNEKKKPHIKKPLNAFMLYMKEMRAKVVAECTLKESAAINQILGRRVS